MSIFVPTALANKVTHDAQPSWFARIDRKVRRLAWSSHRQARRLTARALFSVPLFSARNLRRRVTTFGHYCPHVSKVPPRAARHGNWYLPIRPPEAVDTSPSTAVRAADELAFAAAVRQYQGGPRLFLPEVFVAGVRDARIHANDLLLLSPDNHIFFESALSRPDYLEASGILDSLMLPRGHHLQGEFWLLANRSTRAYYHWLIEVLPRLSTIEQFPELNSVPILGPARLDGFRGESLRLAGVPDNRIVGLPAGTWRVDQLYFPELLGPTGIPSHHAVAWLRRRFLSPTTPAAIATRRIYLTRADAAQRRVLNEPEVIEFLAQLGFEVVCPGGLSFAEQIELFRTVSVVVAPHGAGLANLVFAPPGATVIEFFGDNYINGCFWALACLGHQRHGFIIGPSTWLDYHVSIPDLKAILRKMNVA